jgi:predicted ATPase
MNIGFVTPTEARKISYEETVRFEQIHEYTYRDLGFELSTSRQVPFWIA